MDTVYRFPSYIFIYIIDAHKGKEFMKGCKFADEDVICMANGWLEQQGQQCLYNKNPSLEEKQDQMHPSCRRLCRKPTKYDVHSL